MKSNPFFSVIIPTYNREKFILKSIQSVLEQKFTNYELIIVDDGSTDNTSELVKTYLSNNIHYFLIENSERAAARNFGMSKAKGDYCTFLDSDDIYYTYYLSNAFDFIEKLNQPKFYAQAYEIRTVTGKTLSVTKPTSSNYYKAISKGNFLSCMGVFISKDVCADFKFNEDRNLSGSEDWEFWVRIMARYELNYCTRVCSSMIVHEDRSVLSVNEISLVTRKNLAMKYAFENTLVAQKFLNYKNLMNAYWDTYVSLHLLLDRQTRAGVKYFIQALLKNPVVLCQRRIVSITKLSIQNIFGLR